MIVLGTIIMLIGWYFAEEVGVGIGFLITMALVYWSRRNRDKS